MKVRERCIETAWFEIFANSGHVEPRDCGLYEDVENERMCSEGSTKYSEIAPPLPLRILRGRKGY